MMRNVSYLRFWQAAVNWEVLLGGQMGTDMFGSWAKSPSLYHQRRLFFTLPFSFLWQYSWHLSGFFFHSLLLFSTWFHLSYSLAKQLPAPPFASPSSHLWKHMFTICFSNIKVGYKATPFTVWKFHHWKPQPEARWLHNEQSIFHPKRCILFMPI